MTLSVKLDPLLEQRLRQRGAALGRPASELIREALTSCLDQCSAGPPLAANCSGASAARPI